MKRAEILLISRYAAAELAGALLLGKYARTAKEDYLRKQLTWQCYEEAGHAWMWTKVLQDQNLQLLEIHEKNEYFSYATELKSDIEFLAWAHVYELRADFHLKVHVQMASLDPGFKKTMQQIIEDEDEHLDWIAVCLEKLQKEGNKDIAGYIQKWGDIENRTYLEFVKKLAISDDNYLHELGNMLEGKLPSYAFKWKRFIQA